MNKDATPEKIWLILKEYRSEDEAGKMWAAVDLYSIVEEIVTNREIDVEKAHEAYEKANRAKEDMLKQKMPHTEKELSAPEIWGLLNEYGISKREAGIMWAAKELYSVVEEIVKYKKASEEQANIVLKKANKGITEVNNLPIEYFDSKAWLMP